MKSTANVEYHGPGNNERCVCVVIITKHKEKNSPFLLSLETYIERYTFMYRGLYLVFGFSQARQAQDPSPMADVAPLPES